MKKVVACAILVWAGCLHGFQAQAAPLPEELRPSLPAAALSGQATMTYWGFDIYQATLWVTPGFTETAYENSRFALELAYLRNFKGVEIAKRSIAEMRRQTPASTEQETAWENQMRALFPDVKAGDRITGVHQPGTGAVFWSNGRLLGEVRDPVFAKVFFGIWLAPQTSDPQLRRALLGQAKATATVSAGP